MHAHDPNNRNDTPVPRFTGGKPRELPRVSWLGCHYRGPEAVNNHNFRCILAFVTILKTLLVFTQAGGLATKLLSSLRQAYSAGRRMIVTGIGCTLQYFLGRMPLRGPPPAKPLTQVLSSLSFEHESYKPASISANLICRLVPTRVLKCGIHRVQPPTGRFVLLQPDLSFLKHALVVEPQSPDPFRNALTGDPYPMPYKLSSSASGKGVSFTRSGEVIFSNSQTIPFAKWRSVMQQPIVSVNAHHTVPGEWVLLWTVGTLKHMKIASSETIVSVSVDTFNGFVSRWNTSKNVGIWDIVTYIRRSIKENHIPDDINVEILSQCLMAIVGGSATDNDVSYFTTPIAQDAIIENAPLQIRPYTSILSSPIIKHPAVVPLRHDYTDNAAVAMRLYSVNPGRVRIPVWMQQAINPFVSALEESSVPQQSLVRRTEREIVEGMRTAVTRERMLRSMCNLNRHTNPHIMAFVKREAYSWLKKPRNISAINPEHNLDGFTYSIPFKTFVLNQQQWYMPGSDPSQIVERLVDILSERCPRGFQRTPMESDYSNYDGTQTENVRRIPFKIMARFFEHDSALSFAAMIDDHFLTTAATPAGRRYHTLGSMFSGAWCTTDANTMLTAFVAYCANLRLGMPANEAFRSIGACFGDDYLGYVYWRHGQTVADGLRNYEETARLLGLSVVCTATDQLEDGSRALPFLSRYYQWSDGVITASCADLARMIPKAHLACREVRDPVTYGVQKMSSLLLLTGYHTPVMSSWLQAWFRTRGETPVTVLEDCETLPYWQSVSNTMAPQFPDCSQMLGSYVLEKAAEAFGTDVESLRRADQLFALSANPEQMASAAVDREPDDIPEDFQLIGNNFLDADVRYLDDFLN